MKTPRTYPKAAAEPDVEVPVAPPPPLIYLLADDYQVAKDYASKVDLGPRQYRYVGDPAVLKGVEKPQVVAVGACAAVPQSILDAIVRKQAEVTYANA